MKSLRLTKPHVLVMVGIPGSGKSFFAQHFSDTFNTPFVSWNKIREQLFSQPTYKKKEQALVSKIGYHMLDELLRTEQTIIIEGASDTHTDRTFLAKKVRAAGYEILYIWVQTDPVIAESRAIKPARGKQRLTLAQFDNRTDSFMMPNNTEPTIVISGKHTFPSQLRIVLKRLIKPRAVAADTPKPLPNPTPARRPANRPVTIQ